MFISGRVVDALLMPSKLHGYSPYQTSLASSFYLSALANSPALFINKRSLAEKAYKSAMEAQATSCDGFTSRYSLLFLSTNSMGAHTFHL